MRYTYLESLTLSFKKVESIAAKEYAAIVIFINEEHQKGDKSTYNNIIDFSKAIVNSILIRGTLFRIRKMRIQIRNPNFCDKNTQKKGNQSTHYNTIDFSNAIFDQMYIISNSTKENPSQKP